MSLFKNMFDIDDKYTDILGLNRELQSIYLYNRLIKLKQSIVFVTNSLYESTLVYQSVKNYTSDVFLFPMDDFLTSEALAISPELLVTRLETLNRCMDNKHKIIITNLMGFLRFLPPKDIYLKSIIKLKVNEDYDFKKLVMDFFNVGYTKEVIINKTGEIAVRGFVIDIYPINEENPIRIEFFGDTIESIRFFDVNTQKTIHSIEEINIYPNSEFLLEDLFEINNKNQKELINYLKPVNILDYVTDGIVFVNNYNDIKRGYSFLIEEINNYRQEQKTEENYMHELNDVLKFFVNITKTEDIIGNKPKIYESYDLPYFKYNREEINKQLNEYLRKNKNIIICVSTRYVMNKLIDELDNYNFIVTSSDKIFEGKINLIIKNISNGFEFEKYIVISEKELFNKKELINSYDSKFRIGTKVRDISKISIGDYIVHINHGIGRYLGIKKVSKKGFFKDYILLEYKDGDRLYIPVEKIDIIKKYSSNDSIVPRLNKLGTTEWERTKNKLHKRILDIADDLLVLYAKREVNKGFAFPKDTEEQTNFEQEFNFELTKDQVKVIEEIKRDMEKNIPMDRLLCGDVGFGKTEVAFRAIFKAILVGKQVAFLCPTTILSFQHYNNALERFKNFAVNIVVVNRFVTPNKMKEITENINNGKIDIVIGTHRLLSKDIQFKNLGLLVIDEEQRFGVVQKEKIKKYKTNIDVLTLTATPIPRTLQMTFAGIRDLSLIETPPNNRYPIQTYVMPYNNHLIKDAIYKEKARNGQVFILYNKIENMNLKLSEIKSLVPDLRITFAHGKMPKQALEKVMLDFNHYEYDVLLCTTIIETGIDIPRVNTLIIIDANNFGLSQLYQIRGRVGRSDKIAYCYLMYDDKKILSDIAKKRLEVIKEFTKLGSGLSIAMRDLSIRGAGDILGAEQAGFIESVGIELFLSMLENEIKKLKGEKAIEMERDDSDNSMLNIETSIDDSYVEDEELKLEIHKKINMIDSYQKLQEIKEEIEDRFGKIDGKLLIYMYAEWFEKIMKNLKIDKINQTKNYIEIILPTEITEKIEINDLFIEATKISKMFRFSFKNNNIYIILDTVKLEKHFIYYLIELFDLINKRLSI